MVNDEYVLKGVFSVNGGEWSVKKKLPLWETASWNFNGLGFRKYISHQTVTASG